MKIVEDCLVYRTWNGAVGSERGCKRVYRAIVTSWHYERLVVIETRWARKLIAYEGSLSYILL